MESIILKAHIIIVSLFLVFFLIKTILLLTGSNDLLDKIRKYKVVDMVLGILILLSGGYLWYATSDIYGHRMWLDIKTLLVFIAIPMGIVSMKKGNKIMAIVTLLILIYVYGVAETKSLKFKPDTKKAKVESSENETTEEEVIEAVPMNEDGKALYEANCTMCHGIDGSLGKFSATDLTKSNMLYSQKIDIITNGKGMMTPYSDKLSAEEIKLVAGYLIHLKK